MQCLIVFIIFLCVPFAILKDRPNNFFPHLPVGKFKVFPRAFIRCKPMKEYAIEYNLYMSKISSNASEIRGNITLKRPLDDSLYTRSNLAVKDSIGGWKDNYFTWQFPNTCTSVKQMFGSSWKMIDDNFDFCCPIPRGVYVSKGIDATSFISKMNIPEQFFYGTYKHELIDNKNNQVGCIQIILDVKRPWENE